jgi:2,4-dienoyl-CoA reductase-like NADH-dependent reductase (Old Yellow Enzyme family)
MGIYRDDLVAGLREMVQAVHDRGGRIVVQIAHAGGLAKTELTGQSALAPTCIEGFSQPDCREMTTADIQVMVEAFGQAARRGVAAGFDGVQLHAAHGYLLSQFLSPAFNQRDDAYGGSLENRARALIEVLRRVRSEVGANYPVMVKMNCRDFAEGGLALDDSAQVAGMLQEEGIDAIEVSGGTGVSGDLNPSRSGIASEDKEAYFREEVKRYKENVRVPLILVGGVRSPSVAEELVQSGCADYISLSRPLIREPALVKRWKSGDRRRATCVSDNQCFVPARAGKGLYCVVEKKLQERN